MSARRVAALLIAGILVIAGGLWLATQQRGAGEASSGEAVLPKLKESVNDITEVRLIKGDGTRTVLKKRAADWVVDERGFPADSGKVRKLLLDLAELRVVEEKTSDPANYARLGVQDVSTPESTGTRIEVVGPQESFALIAGNTSGTRSRYLRLADAQLSLLVTPQLSVDADPTQWIDRTVLDIPQARIKEVKVEPAKGPAYTVTRETREQQDFAVPDLPKGQELSSPSAANSIAASIASLSVDDVRKAASPSEKTDDLSTRSAQRAGSVTSRATFQTFDGLIVEVVGREDGSDRLISVNARSSTEDAQAEAQKINARLDGWEIEIPAYKYDAIFRSIEQIGVANKR